MLDLRPFLDHLAWYWIIARHSQALKVQKERNEEELRPITVTKAEELLRRLYELEEKVAAGDTSAVRYFPHLAAMRITRAEFSLTLGRKFGDDDFSNLFSGKGRPFFDRVREFVSEKTYLSWRRSEPLDLRGTHSLHSFLGAWLPVAAPPFFQTLLQWNEQRGITWLAFRDLVPEIAQRFPTWTPDRCIKELQTSPPSATRIAVLPTQDTLPWVADVTSVIRSVITTNDEVLHRLARGAVAEQGWRQADERDGIAVLNAPTPTLLVVCPARSNNAVAADLVTAIDTASHLAAVRGLATYSIVLATSAETKEVLAALPQLVEDRFGLSICYVIGPDALIGTASRHPELWTASVRDDLGFAVVADRNALQLVLGLEESDVENSPIHPAVATADTGGTAVLRIAGKSGSGKSTVLYHLASVHLDSALIVVAQLGGMHRALQQFIRTSSRAVIVLLDDLERQLAIPTASWELASMLAAARAAAIPVRIVMSCLSSERKDVQRVFGGVLLRSSVAEIDLDNVARYEAEEFFAELIRRTARAYGVLLSAGEVLVHARTWSVDGGTPREVVMRVAELRTGSFRQKGADYWRSRFLALLREQRVPETQVLQVLAVLRAAEGAAMPRSLVLQLFTGVFERTSVEFEHALAVLIADGWVRAWREELYADTVQLGLELTHLLRHGAPTSTYRQLVSWIALNVASIPFAYRDWLRRHARQCLSTWGEDSRAASLHDDWQTEADDFIAAGGGERLATECDLTLWRLFVRSLGKSDTSWAERLIAQWPLANEDPVILQGILEECGMNGWFDQAQKFLDWLFFARAPEVAVSLLESMILHEGTETIIAEVTRELRSRGLITADLEDRVLAVEAFLKGEDSAVLPDVVAIIESAIRRGALAFAERLVDNLPEATLTTPERRRLVSLRQIVHESGTSIPIARQLFERLHT